MQDEHVFSVALHPATTARGVEGAVVPGSHA